MIICDLSIQDYHSSCPEFLSKTTIRDYQTHGPAWFKMVHIDKTLAKKVPGGVEQGSAIDCWLTEGEATYRNRYAIKPEGMSFVTKEGKAWKESIGDCEIITAEDHAILLDAVAAVRGHPKWPEIEKCKAQQTIRRKSDGLGLGLQSRPDFLNTDKGLYFDLKKCRDLDLFSKQAVSLGYALQAGIAAWCLAGMGIVLEETYLIAVEWERGARCRVYRVLDEALIAADSSMRAAAAEIADRIKRNDWTDHPPESEILQLTDWQIGKIGAT